MDHPADRKRERKNESLTDPGGTPTNSQQRRLPGERGRPKEILWQSAIEADDGSASSSSPADREGPKARIVRAAKWNTFQRWSPTRADDTHRL